MNGPLFAIFSSKISEKYEIFPNSKILESSGKKHLHELKQNILLYPRETEITDKIISTNMQTIPYLSIYPWD